MPTDLGFRMYVDGLLELGNLSEDDRAGIDSRCGGSGRSVEAMLSDASGALAGLSHYAGLVLAPKTESPFKQVEFVPLSPGRALVVVVSSNGMVENRVIEVPVGIGASTLLEAGNFLTARLTGRSLAEAREIIEREIAERRGELDVLAGKVVQAGLATWAGERVPDEGVLIVRGQAKLLDDVTNLADLERIRGAVRAARDQAQPAAPDRAGAARRRRADLHRLGERAVRHDRLLGRRGALRGGREGGLGPREDRRRDRRDRPDADELCAHHPDGRLHRPGGLAPARQP